MDAGIRALDHELSNAVETADGGLTWNYVANAGGIVSPYWDRGTAGVGAVVLRYACVRPDVPRYRTLLEKITVDERPYWNSELNGHNPEAFLRRCSRASEHPHRTAATLESAMGGNIPRATARKPRQDGFSHPLIAAQDQPRHPSRGPSLHAYDSDSSPDSSNSQSPACSPRLRLARISASGHPVGTSMAK